MPIGPSRPLNLAKPESIDIRQAARYFGARGEADEYDRMAVYALAINEENLPGGAGRLYIGDDSQFTIDRVGVESLEEALFSGELLARKDEILAAPLKERP